MGHSKGWKNAERGLTISDHDPMAGATNAQETAGFPIKLAVFSEDQ
jgi:hypothetical protein